MIPFFLRYSLAHTRAIKVLFANTLKYANIIVVALEHDSFSYISARNKRPVTCSMDSLLAAGYARGDKGDIEGE